MTRPVRRTLRKTFGLGSRNNDLVWLVESQYNEKVVIGARHKDEAIQACFERDKQSGISSELSDYDAKLVDPIVL